MGQLCHDVIEALSGEQMTFHNEAHLQAEIGRVLEGAGIEYVREVVLSPADRIDFLVAGGLGIEVKVAGSPVDLARQLVRYAAHDLIDELLVVTTRYAHTRLPPRLGEPPVPVSVLALTYMGL